MDMEQRKYQAAGCWSQLPQDLLGIIANRLSAIEDFVSFSSVCSSWRSAVPKQEWIPCDPRLPWLLLTDYKDEERKLIGLYNMERKKLYRVEVPLLNYTNGWIFKTEGDLSRLIDPLTGFQIPLPRIDNPKLVAKVLVSQRPSESDNITNNKNNNDVFVVLYYFESVELVFARPGSKQWITLQDDFEDRDIYFYNGRYIFIGDVVRYKGRVFAVRSNGTLVLCEIDCPSPKAIDIALPPPLKYRIHVNSCYLVESKGDLLAVMQYPEILDTGFEVFKFNERGAGGQYWTKMKDLGGCTLFLSHSCSVSISPSDQVDCRANCIYYTACTFCCRFTGNCYLNVFDMKDNTTDHYSITSLSHISDFRGSVWVMPSFGLGLGST
ncbi:hypothetical protein LguiB_006511 [Lonicera macranthoides]